MKRSLAAAFLYLLLLAGRGWALTSGVGFLDIPVGGRPLSLGGAYTALAQDAYALVWNPAGLATLGGAQIASMHVAFVESMSYDYVGFARPFGGKKHGLGASVQYFSPGSIDGFDEQGNPAGDFSGSYEAYSLGYGYRLSRRLSLGAAAKLIHAQMGDLSSASYAGDAGAAFQVNERLTVAAAAANFGTPVRFIEEKEPLPAALRFGAAFEAIPGLLIAAEGVHSTGDSSGARLGAEWRALEWTSLRAGYRIEPGSGAAGASGITAGFGLHFWGQQLDYAFVPLGELGNAQYFSLVIRLDRFLADEN